MLCSAPSSRARSCRPEARSAPCCAIGSKRQLGVPVAAVLRVHGLRTQIGLLDNVVSWAICLGIIAVATAGKLGGTVIAARWTGLPWRDSVALGALMNTRGLMELIALNVGYDLGILTPEIFAMMVLMALVTTAMTGPLLSLSLNWGRRREPAAAAPMARSS